MSDLELRLDGQALAQLLASDNGPVAHAVIEGATRVQEAARDQVGKDTRNLERDIIKRPFARGSDFGMEVGSDLPYALIHHEGRGPIVAKNAKALRFTIGGVTIFRKRVGPAAPNRYLTDNLRRALP